MEEDRCLGHMNGFAHLSTDVGQIGREFDLGYRFEFRDSDSYEQITATGTKAWAEPYLALYVSAHSRSVPCRDARALQYGLTRSKFSTGTMEPTKADRQRLLELAMPHLKEDLKVLSKGEKLASIDEPRML